jgi:hypothetical protein
LVSVVVLAVFVIFAGVLFRGDFQSGSMRREPVGGNRKRHGFWSRRCRRPAREQHFLALGPAESAATFPAFDLNQIGPSATVVV